MLSFGQDWRSDGLGLRLGTGSCYVIEHAGLRFRVPPPEGHADDRLLYLGDDEDGAALEVMAVELQDGGLYVIHAMPLRKRYEDPYEEAKKWRV